MQLTGKQGVQDLVMAGVLTDQDLDMLLIDPTMLDSVVSTLVATHGWGTVQLSTTSFSIVNILICSVTALSAGVITLKEVLHHLREQAASVRWLITACKRLSTQAR